MANYRYQSNVSTFMDGDKPPWLPRICKCKNSILHRRRVVELSRARLLSVYCVSAMIRSSPMSSSSVASSAVVLPSSN